MSRASAVRLSCIVITTPGSAAPGSGAAAPSRSSRAGRRCLRARSTTTGSGISRCVAATSALTVSSPSAGGQSMTMCAYSPSSFAILSLSLKCASSSPTSRASSFASPIRAGAMNRFASGRRLDDVARASSRRRRSRRRCCGVIASWSRNEMLLLACGSRSMSSVFRPRIASAAARFTAVVVLPTPPFWLAMATIIVAVRLSCGGATRPF